jgi:hypothetical protein
MVETVSATSRTTRPVVIFKGKTPQTTWFRHNEVPNWIYTASENGWTSNQIPLAWLTDVFLPEAQPSSDEARLLIFDGHGSHITVDFLWTCKQNNVYVVFLPPHSIHVLQPLDLSCFSPVKSRYRSHIAALASLDDAAPVKKYRFIKYYHLAREEGLTLKTIKSGWRASGIYPWNPQKGLRSSQVKTKAKTNPPSPPSLNYDDIDVLATPKSYRDVYYIIQSLDNGHMTERETRAILKKAGKRIGQLAAQNAASESKIHSLES